MNKFIYFLFIFWSFSALAEQIEIKSNPEKAEIYVKNTSTKERVKIGKTPLKMSMNEIVNNFAKANVFILEIEKEGFDPYRVLITRTGANDIFMVVNLEISKNIQMVKILSVTINLYYTN